MQIHTSYISPADQPENSRRPAGFPLILIRSMFLALTVMALLNTQLLAQSTLGSIRGVVQDASGAALPGAQITLNNIDENTDRALKADDSGLFAVENVKPGHYRVVAQATGFAQTVLNGIALDARQDLRVTLTMSVAAAETTTVEVSSTADQINTENASLSDSKDNMLITQLPLNNRATTTSPLGSLTLSPNVQQDSSGNIALGGASSSMVNFSVDGISTANVRQNGALQDAYPSQEGISGVKITAFNNSAEFSQVGDVTFTTKSGTNTYHGSIFEYFQNDALDASPYGFSGKAPKRFNTFGGALGGPVNIPHIYDGKNRTFFFADYEANRRTTSVAQQFLVPTEDERNGNLSGLGSNVVIPVNQISATAKALLAYYPLPNVTGQSNFNYENFQSTPARTDGADIRLDQTITSKQSAYARFSRKNITSNYANPLLPNDIDSVHNRSLLVSHTYILTQRLLNEARFGFTNVSTNVNFPIAGASALSQLNLQGVDISQHPDTHAFPTFNFSSGTSLTPIGRDKAGTTLSKTLQFSDNLTYTFGKHTVKGGIDIRRVRYFDLESFAPAFASDDFGSFIFQSTFTGNAFGDFLEGAPTTLNFAVSSPDVGGTATQFSFFGQDEYQLNSRLTLSYGLRWQLLPGFHEDGGNLANFDQNNNAIVVPDALGKYLAQQNIEGSNLAFQQSFNACNLEVSTFPCTRFLTASQDHLPQSLRHTYFGNFQPRLAVAYRPFNDTKTVIRAGFGVYTMTNLGPLSFNNSGNPTSNLHSYANANTAGPNTPQIVFPQTAPATIGVRYGGGSLDQGVDPNYRDPQSNQWSLTLERQLDNNTTFRASYVGMHTYRLSITEDLNQLPASTTPYATAAASPYVDPRAPYQNWFSLLSTFNAGKANYHAFEFEGTHRMSNGLYFDANYTLATNQADNQGDAPSYFAGEVNYGLPVADRFHISQNYGNSEGTRRQRFLLTGVYQLPFGSGRRFANASGWQNLLIGGWELTNVSMLQSGPWLTPSISAGGCQVALAPDGSCPQQSTYDQSNTNVVNRGAVLRPDVVSHDYASGRSRDHYFNAAAFAPTPVGAGRFGNAGVGILQGPGTAAISLGLGKNFTVTEHVRARFESTFTNVLNRTNFAPPTTQVDNTAAFGVLSAPQTAENSGNRTGQVALRFDF